MTKLIALSKGGTAKLKTLAHRYGIELIIEFGSRVRGDARRDSDLDVGVLFECMPTPRQFAAFEARLLNLLNDDVHVVPLNFVNPELRVAATREGRVLYQKQSHTWTRFSINNLHLLHDARRLREYDNDLIARFLEKHPNDQGLQHRRSTASRREHD